MEDTAEATWRQQRVPSLPVVSQYVGYTVLLLAPPDRLHPHMDKEGLRFDCYLTGILISLHAAMHHKASTAPSPQGILSSYLHSYDGVQIPEEMEAKRKASGCRFGATGSYGEESSMSPPETKEKINYQSWARRRLSSGAKTFERFQRTETGSALEGHAPSNGLPRPTAHLQAELEALHFVFQSSIHGPSAAISLLQWSGCYEQSACRITSRITTQKIRLLRAQRRRRAAAITPRVKRIRSSVSTRHAARYQAPGPPATRTKRQSYRGLTSSTSNAAWHSRLLSSMASFSLPTRHWRITRYRELQ
ncbi:hypothetical protein EYF80_047600 [Liparis tanakae]|uniref:Uncharacterized protein n=1 Tax=Liparis tanakae TaxID=230148 RepID=A0A4Z2FMV5_9TELE|nr:hypothetical protein EYF80_047600 [Liparis tanakae]